MAVLGVFSLLQSVISKCGNVVSISVKCGGFVRIARASASAFCFILGSDFLVHEASRTGFVRMANAVFRWISGTVVTYGPFWGIVLSRICSIISSGGGSHSSSALIIEVGENVKYFDLSITR
jgi:hypothetical protein